MKAQSLDCPCFHYGSLNRLNRESGVARSRLRDYASYAELQTPDTGQVLVDDNSRWSPGCLFPDLRRLSPLLNHDGLDWGKLPRRGLDSVEVQRFGYFQLDLGGFAEVALSSLVRERVRIGSER